MHETLLVYPQLDNITHYFISFLHEKRILAIKDKKEDEKEPSEYGSAIAIFETKPLYENAKLILERARY